MTREIEHVGTVAMDDPIEVRIREIEQALKFDPEPHYRRALKREFLDLTDPERINYVA